MGKLADRYAWADKVARSYTPMKKQADPAVWSHVREDFVDVACRYFDESRYIPEAIERPQRSFEMSVYQIMQVISALLVAGYKQGRTTPEEVFNERFVLWFLDNSGSPRDFQRLVRRFAVLICEALFPGVSVGEIRDYETPYDRKLITYTPAEMENFRRCGFEMGDEKYRVPYLGVLALAAAAGLDRLDALKVRVGDVTESNGLIAVTVTGSYPRVVPVFRQWSDDLAPLLDGADENDYLLFPDLNENSRYDRTKLPRLLRYHRGNPPTPRYDKLRLTWTSSLIGEGIDYATIAYLAGYLDTSYVAQVAYRLMQANPVPHRTAPLDPFMANRVANLRSGVGL